MYRKVYAQMFNLFKETMVEFKRKSYQIFQTQMARKLAIEKNLKKIFELKKFDNKKHILML